MIFASNPLYCFKPFEEILQMLTPHFDGWEFLAEMEHSWLHRENIHDMISTSDMHLQIHAPFNDINIASMNPNIVDTSISEIENTFKLAAFIDVQTVTVHPGIYSPLGKFWDGAHPTVLRSLKRLSILAEEHGVVCALENMPNLRVTMGVTSEEIYEMISHSNLKFCMDVGHAFTSDTLNAFLDFGITPVNLHIHDNIGKDDEHRTLGEGDIPLEYVLKKLTDYKGNYVIEGRNLESLLASKVYLETILRKL